MTHSQPDLEHINRIDAWLPQTQCTRCGYPTCRAYAEDVARGAAGINQCPPGGEATIAGLAQLLEVPPLPLGPQFGAHAPRTRAVIDETRCIGCRKCLDVCPVDAIVGARKLMHTVIARDCTGCELCLPPCPVDCIALVPVPAGTSDAPWLEYARAETGRWRALTKRRLTRQTRRKRRGATVARARRATASRLTHKTSAEIKADIQAAVARVRARRARSLGKP